MKVIPYDPATGIGDDVIKRDIESDPRFAYPRARIDWLKQHKNTVSGGKEPGHKVEIDAVLARAGSEGLWNYLMKQMAKAHPRRNYTRVIHEHKYAPVPATIGFTIPSIVGQVQIYMRNRADSITKQKREDMDKKLKQYKGFLIVQDKVNTIRKDLSTMVNEEDQEIKDISSVMSEAAKSVEGSITEAVTTAINKLDEEKGYGIMASIMSGTGGGGGEGDEERGGGS